MNNAPTSPQVSTQQLCDKLRNELADILLGPESPVRGSADFEKLIAEHDRLISRESELKALDAKLVDVLPGLEQTESYYSEAQKQLASENKQLDAFAGELGKTAFEGLRTGKLPDHPIFADRKQLQLNIESLQRQRSELTSDETTGMIEKAKVRTLQLKLMGQIKIEELKVNSTNKALGQTLLKSKENLSVLCSETEDVLKAIDNQRKQVVIAQEQVIQAEQAVADRRSAAAELLDRSNVTDAASLKSELKDVRKEHRHNEKLNISIRTSIVETALAIESLRKDANVGEILKQLWSLNFDIDSNKSQVTKFSEESVARFKLLPKKIQIAAACLSALVFLAMLSVFLQDRESISIESEKTALAALETFGAKIFREDTGRVHVEMPAKTTDSDLQLLRGIRHLRALGLSSTKVTDDGLVSLPEHETLETLSLADSNVTNSGMASIGKIKQLEAVDLSRCNISDEGISKLLELRALDHLVLNETNISDNGCKEIAKLKSITKLFLNTTKITDAGVVEIAKLSNLQRLGIGDTRTSNTCLKSLSHLTKLEVLGLFDTKVSDSGLKYLETLPQLTTLELSNSDVSSRFNQLWTSRSKIKNMLKEARTPQKATVASSKRSYNTNPSSTIKRRSSNSAGMSDADKFALQLLMGAAIAEQRQNQMRQQQQQNQLNQQPLKACTICAGTGLQPSKFGSGLKHCLSCGGTGKTRGFLQKY